MPVTGSMLYNLVECPHRVSLDRFGDKSLRDPTNPFVAMLWERGNVYEREVVAKIAGTFLDLSDCAKEDRARLTSEAMAAGVELIYSGEIAVDDLLGIPDLLRREGRGYVAGDIKSGNGEEDAAEGDGKPKRHYAMQLALYTDILERLRLSPCREGFIWDIRGQEVRYRLNEARGEKVKLTLWQEYQDVLNDARAIIDNQGGTLPAYSSKCKLCWWYSSCVSDLEVRRDLTLIPLLGRKIRDVLNQDVQTIEELAGLNADGVSTGKDGSKTIYPGLGSKRLREYIHRAKLLSEAGAKPELTGVLRLKPSARELFFDIEVDPLRDHCYLHGIVERNGGDEASEIFISFFTEDETQKSERVAFKASYDYLTSGPAATIYYYSKYERTLYRKLQAKYPDVCSAGDIEALFDPEKAIDLYFDVVTKSTEWPTYDHSIKTLARHLGFSWRDTHPSGAASIEWFDQWVKFRDPIMKQRILDYNEDDCRATRVLLDGILSL